MMIASPAGLAPGGVFLLGLCGLVRVQSGFWCEDANAPNCFFRDLAATNVANRNAGRCQMQFSHQCCPLSECRGLAAWDVHAANESFQFVDCRAHAFFFALAGTLVAFARGTTRGFAAALRSAIFLLTERRALGLAATVVLPFFVVTFTFFTDLVVILSSLLG